MNNLVSIITPNYNSSKYIKDTIKSVLNQTYENWEWIITDDGSTDESAEYIKNLCNEDSRIKLFKQTNLGPAKARNNSIKNAKGQYLAFLDSDDIWFPEFLSTSIKKIADWIFFFLNTPPFPHKFCLYPIQVSPFQGLFIS